MLDVGLRRVSMPRARWALRSRLQLQAGSCLQDSRFWGRGSDSEDDSEDEVSDSEEEEEESDASDSDSDSSDNDDAAGYVLAILTIRATSYK